MKIFIFPLKGKSAGLSPLFLYPMSTELIRFIVALFLTALLEE